MISEESIDDPEDWVNEHPHTPCPGESSLGPMITFSRNCRLYADMLAGMNGDQSNLRLLNWIELEWKRWRSRWLEKNSECRRDVGCWGGLDSGTLTSPYPPCRCIHLSPATNIPFQNQRCSLPLPHHRIPPAFHRSLPCTRPGARHLATVRAVVCVLRMR
jgi:hypothetical protein